MTGPAPGDGAAGRTGGERIMRRTRRMLLAIATLDTSVAKKWKVYPDLPGYKVVKEYAEIVDYQKDVRFKGDLIPGSKQEFPELTFALVGDEGHNLVNIVVAK